MKFLVVDDEKDWHEYIERAFRGCDAEIEFIDDAETAIERLGQEDVKFDRLICDGLEGNWEAVHKVAEKRGLSIFLYTNNPDFLEKATSLGIPGLMKTESLSKLKDVFFPPSGTIEAK